MPSENFYVGVVSVELRAVEATNVYRVYATIGNVPPVTVCDVDKAQVDASGDPTGTCKTEAERHILAALEQYNSANL